MEREYSYSLEGYHIRDSASVTFSLLEGFPSLTVTLADANEINALSEAYTSGSLIGRNFSFKAQLTGIKTIVSLPKLAMVKLTPQETVGGYVASAMLIPAAAAFANTFPAVFTDSNYKHSVRSLITSIMSSYNNAYPQKALAGLTFEALRDPIALTPPRFTEMSYFTMIRQVAGRHGLVACIGFDSILRVFVPTSPGGQSNVTLSKHNTAKNSLSFDILQTLVS